MITNANTIQKMPGVDDHQEEEKTSDPLVPTDLKGNIIKNHGNPATIPATLKKVYAFFTRTSQFIEIYENRATLVRGQFLAVDSVQAAVFLIEPALDPRSLKDPCPETTTSIACAESSCRAEGGDACAKSLGRSESPGRGDVPRERRRH